MKTIIIAIYCTLKIQLYKYVQYYIHMMKQHLKNKVTVEPTGWSRWGW